MYVVGKIESGYLHTSSSRHRVQLLKGGRSKNNVIHSLRLASFRYMSRMREDRKCFSSVLACAREDLRLSLATRALSSSLSIFILP